MSSKKSNIAIIGAGKIAFSLTNSLINANYKVDFVISKNINSAKKLADKFSIKNYSDDLKSLSKKIKIFILSVPDGEIEKTAIELSKLNLDFKNSLFIHLSGTQNISSLNSLKRKKAKTASFHIMQTFPSKKIIKFKKNYAAIETENKEVKKFLFRLAERINLIPFLLNSDQKINYHLTGVFASNFFITNLFISQEIFNSISIDKKIEFVDFINPIIETTFRNVKNSGVQNSLSGPIERGDIETIKKHIISLNQKNKKSKKDFNIYFLIYIYQSLTALEIVKSRKSLNENHIKIKQILNKEIKKYF